MKEFITAATEAAELDEDCIEVPLDGQIYKAYKPTDGQFAFVFATSGKFASTEEQAAGQINFFISLFDEDDQQVLGRRLLDRKDPFGMDMVGEILESLIEEWSGRPTQASSASSPSPKPTGQKSTPRTPKSISSGSPSIAS